MLPHQISKQHIESEDFEKMTDRIPIQRSLCLILINGLRNSVKKNKKENQIVLNAAFFELLYHVLYILLWCFEGLL